MEKHEGSPSVDTSFPRKQSSLPQVRRTGIQCTIHFNAACLLQYNLDIRIPKLTQKTKGNARYPYNEVWHTAKLIPAGPADVSLKTRISLFSGILISRLYCNIKPSYPHTKLVSVCSTKRVKLPPFLFLQLSSSNIPGKEKRVSV
jgi:hypothetical protein